MQKRRYILSPYGRVIDIQLGIDYANANAVLRGDLTPFLPKIEGELEQESISLTISAGCEERDSREFSYMLLQMYMYWSEKQNMGYMAKVIEEGCYSLFIQGADVYKLLRNEKGIHSLSRISRFDPEHRRITSFCTITSTPA